MLQSSCRQRQKNVFTGFFHLLSAKIWIQLWGSVVSVALITLKSALIKCHSLTEHDRATPRLEM